MRINNVRDATSVWGLCLRSDQLFEVFSLKEDYTTSAISAKSRPDQTQMVYYVSVCLVLDQSVLDTLLS